jgi:RND family efflux transporter MFP subunit
MKYRAQIYAICLFTLWLVLTGGMSYLAFVHQEAVKDSYEVAYLSTQAKIEGARNGIQKSLDNGKTILREDFDFGTGLVVHVKNKTVTSFEHTRNTIKDKIDTLLSVTEPEEISQPDQMRAGFINMPYDAPPLPLTLSEIRKHKEEEIEKYKEEDAQAHLYAQIMPAGAPPAPLWEPEQMDLDVEAVLVPRLITVVSSSQDGRIAVIAVNHGDRFQKGDLLVAYDCAILRAESDIAKIEKSYTEKHVKGSDSLFKLDIISELDRAGAQIEDQKASVKEALYQSRLKDCEIRAEFSGRVTNRLANPGEYTRTDRVLLEVGSDGPLQAEFLVPSKWLRWINIGAPVSITLGETERNYTAKIERIHGEIDPVSQTIQMIATLDPYQDALLPGMSGKARINIDAVRNAGVRGYLEVGTEPGSR